LRELAGQPDVHPHFYGMLAAEALGEHFRPPDPPPAPTPAEAAAAERHPGLASALALIALGLRDEGNREWNYSLRGMSDRELLAASQLACEREVWDRCINTSERTRDVVDMQQRYPMPWRQPLEGRSLAQGLDPALTYGVVRQESRFVMRTRSSAGAGGLMQLMPRTARWTADKIGITDYAPERLYEPEVNAALGTGYLKMVLDEFGGSQALATAAYNAGPHRARRWREGAAIDAAAWVETIPFTETRDYVKRVLSNAVVYSQRLGLEATSLRQRLGATIGPPAGPAPGGRADLP
jgi:soluble lytic murein transglycosylase